MLCVTRSKLRRVDCAHQLDDAGKYTEVAEDDCNTIIDTNTATLTEEHVAKHCSYVNDAKLHHPACTSTSHTHREIHIQILSTHAPILSQTHHCVANEHHFPH